MDKSRFVAIFLLLLIFPVLSWGDETVSYRNEVMAILGRAGCNQGTCHGNLNGKGGFKLSLRGENPTFDHQVMTRHVIGRRVNVHDPDASLILQKATATIPHEGGQRFTKDSNEYRIMRNWIAAGAPDDHSKAAKVTELIVSPKKRFLIEPEFSVQIQAHAKFSDGTIKDVGSLAVFESSNAKFEPTRDGVVATRESGETTIVVRYLEKQATAQLAFVPARPDFAWQNPPINNYVDEHVFARLKKLRMNPSQLASDSEFLRRVYIDLLGILPTPAEAMAFFQDQSANKRSQLIDALLERSEFADYWAVRFSDFLRNEQKSLDRKGTRVYYQWIRQSIAKNKPLNEFARELIASRGSTYIEPAANYYRALRDSYSRSEATAQVFLGIRMQCAKCHNHPFNTWTQNDYHQLAAFFPRVQYKIIENKRRDRLDKHEFVGEQVVYMDKSSEVKHPNTGKVLTPKYLGGETVKSGEDRLKALADWVANPNNPFFARTQANRIWSYLMGRGIVEPNDDFRDSNPPSNGPLLAALADDLRKNDFDMKHLIRVIMNSRTYQLSSVPNETNGEDQSNFSKAIVRSLPAEPLLDAVSGVTEIPVQFDGYPLGTRATQLPGMPVANRRTRLDEGLKFLRVFGKPERLLNCDCERNDNTTMVQALQFITGSLVNEAITAENNRIGRLLKEGKSNEEIVDELFLAALSRRPGTAIRAALVARVESAANRRKGLEDVLWALVNSKEFLLRR